MFKVGDQEYQNTKIFLPKVMFQIGLKKFLWLKKSKILQVQYMLLVNLKESKLLERSTKANCKKLIAKVIKSKCGKLYVKWKGYDSSFNS